MISERFRSWGGWLYLLLATAVLALTGLVVTRYAPRYTPELARITIGDFPNYVNVPGQHLRCAPPSKGISADCRVLFEGQELHVVIVDVMVDGAMIIQCRATYAGATVGCGAGYLYTPEVKPGARITDTLGVSPARMALLRLRNPWSHLGDIGWLLVVMSVSALLAWLSVQLLKQVRRAWPRPALVGAGVSLFLVLLVRMGSGLLSLGFID